MMSFDQLDYMNQVLGLTEDTVEKKPGNTIIARMRSGACLCTKCGNLSEPPITHTRLRHGRSYPICSYGCQYDNCNPAQVITWQDVMEDLAQTVSERDWQWLEREHPELIAAAGA